MTYAEKLKDPRWIELRNAVKRRDNNTCVSCGAKDKPLEVHHKSYHGEPWDAPMDELDTLCSGCHEAVEQIVRTIRGATKFRTLHWAVRRLARIYELDEKAGRGACEELGRLEFKTERRVLKNPDEMYYADDGSLKAA
jgi:hypothetical protein